jgi:uncharacterized membrane protein
MLVLVLGWLARHRKGRVVLAAGTALTAAGIGIFLAGFTTHQPLVTRAGVLITGLAVAFAALAVRARHSRTRADQHHEDQRHEALGQSRRGS